MPDGIFMQSAHLRFYQYYMPDGICFPINKKPTVPDHNCPHLTT